jgi:hypothetical protein
MGDAEGAGGGYPALTLIVALGFPVREQYPKGDPSGGITEKLEPRIGILVGAIRAGGFAGLQLLLFAIRT